MDTETLKTFYSCIKGYTMLLTDLIDKNTEDFQYIINREHLNVVTFGLASGILLYVKEDVVDGVTESFSPKIFNQNLLDSVSLIARKKADGFYINNHKFNDAASVVGDIRIAIAHGAFELDANNNKVILFIHGDNVEVDINSFTNMIVSCFDYSMKNPSNDSYQRDFIFSNKVETKRTKPFKNKDEILRFASTYRHKSLTLKSRDGSPLNELIIKKFEYMLEFYKETQNPELIKCFEENNKDYKIEQKHERIKYNILESSASEVFANSNEDIEYTHQVDVLSRVIDAKRKPSFNLVNSFLENLGLVETLKKINITDKASTLQYLKNKTDVNLLSYNTIAGASLLLFLSMFSYGNDYIFETLDYEQLDLSCLNVLYYEPDVNEIERLKANISKDTNIVKGLVKNKNKQNANLAKTNNSAAIKAINSLIASLDNDINILNQEINTLTNDLNNALNGYSKAYVINGIRNCIAHGNYKFISTNGDCILLFEDIYQNRLTFKCEVNMIDFINMIYTNQNIIISYLSSKQR